MSPCRFLHLLYRCLTVYEHDSLGRQFAIEVTADDIINGTESEFNSKSQRTLVRDSLGLESFTR
ncbi:hypothetical protein Pla110_44870 [Polystyrenella longa]|uniref:Uncharacterized protein n=1 Tax=Polystyrenella longa TaxID=2528007 RepID=A0A518CU33_9PLAN|nr:hypothetical protein Pla110_44870 [Polystyrenella longa]